MTTTQVLGNSPGDSPIRPSSPVIGRGDSLSHVFDRFSGSGQQRFFSTPNYTHFVSSSEDESLSPAETGSPRSSSPEIEVFQAEIGQSIGQLTTAELTLLNKFVDALIQKLSQPAAGFPVTGAVASQEDVLADISMFIRTLMPSSPVMHAVGVTTALNLLTGLRATIQGAVRFNEAYEIRDTGGMIESGLDTFRGFFQSVAGLFYCVFRPASIAAEIHGANATVTATTAAGKVAYLSGVLGNLFFVGFYALVAAWGAFMSGKMVAFRNQLKEASQSDQELLAFFKKKVQIDRAHGIAKLEGRATQPKGISERLYKAYLRARGMSDTAIANKFREKLQNELKGAALEYLSKGLTDLPEGSHLSIEEAKKGFELLSRMMRSPEHGVATALSMQAVIDADPLAEMGFKLEEASRGQRKLRRFIRVTNAEAFTKVQKALQRGLEARLNSEDPLVRGAAKVELDQLKVQVLKANMTQLLVHIMMTAFGVIGIPIFVLGFMTLGTLLTTVYTGSSLLLAAMMFSTDFYYWIQGMDPAGQPGKYDKAFCIAIAVVLAAVVAVSLALTFTYGLPLLPLIVSIAFCALAFGINGYSYYRIDQREKRWEAEHPTPEVVLELLQNDAIPEQERLELFHERSQYLPTSDQAKIRAQIVGRGAFNTERYIALNADNRFGENLYRQYVDGLTGNPTPEGFTAEEKEKIVLALNRTTEYFWEVNQEENALVAEKLRILLSTEGQNLVEHVQFLSELKTKHADVFNQLAGELHYAFLKDDLNVAQLNMLTSIVGDLISSKPVAVSAADPAFSRLANLVSHTAAARLPNEEGHSDLETASLLV